MRHTLKDRSTYLGILLSGIVIVVIAAYYLNHPRAELLADTWSYLYVVDRIQNWGQVVNFWRLPGYPLFIVGVYALFGQGNIMAVGIVQAVLFFLATLEVYLLALLLTHKPWLAFGIGLMIGINFSLLSYIKPLMSEGLALWLFVSLSLSTILFLRSLQQRFFWLMIFFALLLFWTRPEWMYLPVCFFAYLLYILFQKGQLRRFIVPVCLSLVLLYSLLGAYVEINTVQNHFPGVTWIQNINALGKVLQYHMQNEEPPQYAGVSRILDADISRHMDDPYGILAHEPSLSNHHAQLMGAFALAVIEHHPVEFVQKSIPLFFSSLTVYHNESTIAPRGAFATPLFALQSVFRILYNCNLLFPLCALIWLLCLISKRTRALPIVHMMGALVVLVCYGLIMTTLGAYRDYDYVRIHILFHPILLLIMGVTIVYSVQFVGSWFMNKDKKISARPEHTSKLIWQQN